MNIISTIGPDSLIALSGVLLGFFITAVVLISTYTRDRKDMTLTLESMERAVALADELVKELVEENERLKKELEKMGEENRSLKEEKEKLQGIVDKIRCRKNF